MAASREVVYLKDFSGGLNLTRQTQSLSKNESPDALNVDFGLRGGFMLRGGFQSQAYDVTFPDVGVLGATYFGEDVLMCVDSAGNLLKFDGAAYTDTTFNVTDLTTPTTVSDNRPRMAVFNRKAYFANCWASTVLQSYSYDGTTGAAFGAFVFNNDYLAAVGGDMLPARHVASHAGYLWQADTVESGTRYPHRVRWSHLQKPEDWAEADYVDCDPSDDGDPITALVAFKGALLVFKRSTVYAIYGTDKDTFTMEALTVASGVSNPRSVTVSDGYCFWVTVEGNIMQFDGRSQPKVMTDRLGWWVDTNKIQAGGDHILMWSNGSLYMSFEAGTAEDQTRYLFVYNPELPAVTRYDKQPREMFNWIKVGQQPDALFLFVGDDNVYRYDRSYSYDTKAPAYLLDVNGNILLDQADDELDQVSDLGANVHRIDGYYRTGWITADETATKKRWKRPRVTAAADDDATIKMEVYHDFYGNVMSKTSEFIIDAAGSATWNGTFMWGDPWPDGVDDVYAFKRQPSAGSARAIQFKFSSSDNLGRWWVDSIAVPFRRKRVK